MYFNNTEDNLDRFTSFQFEDSAKKNKRYGLLYNVQARNKEEAISTFMEEIKNNFIHEINVIIKDDETVFVEIPLSEFTIIFRIIETPWRQQGNKCFCLKEVGRIGANDLYDKISQKAHYL